MNALIRGWRYAAVAALTIALPLAAACSAEGAGTGTGEDDATDESALEIEFPEMYSAFDDGEHEFKVPAKTGVKNAKWSADPADAVGFEKQPDGSTMITIKKYYEEVTIKAKAGSLSATAKLHITKATPELWMQGNERYNNGVFIKKPERPDGGWPKNGEGGGRRGDGGLDKITQGGTLSCANCHNRGATGKDDGKTDIEHTPTQTGGFSDEELITIFTKGQKPEGVEIHSPKLDEEKYARMHSWKMEEDEKQGLVIYLRSLTPEKMGKYDFGGGIFGKGGKRHGDGDGKRDRDEDKGGDKPEGDDKPATN